ncbi:MAG: ABC transporter permease [Betaproteobacteria bacterium HGW-Betaproteobacteria-11]|nr:MAG: ABC transporter permease [Betaproteobacteria bacterium HGW-Betaproteobacteria-11]
MVQARIDVQSLAEGGCDIVLAGRWTLAQLADHSASLTTRLRELAAQPKASWNVTAMEALDSAGAMLLWRAWDRRLPEILVTRPDQLRILERIAAADRQQPPGSIPRSPFACLMDIGVNVLGLALQLLDFAILVGQMLLCTVHLLRTPQDLPRREFSANLYKSGVLAMPVSALVGFLIGVVLSYLSALQLRQYGAEIFIVNILGMGIVRELGPVLVAVLVAGRSGSAMTAQLGVMRVTEEIDALVTVGVSRALRLVFPKVAALAVAMPLLVLWTTVLALIGGMVSAQIQLDISYAFFIEQLPKAVPMANLLIGLLKGIVFGVTIALVACHFGLRVRPNTESLSANTTASVVTAITAVILLDAVFAIATRNIGIPQ